MTTMNISVPEEMKAFVEAQMTQEGYASASEYLRALIRDAQSAGPNTSWKPNSGRQWRAAPLRP